MVVDEATRKAKVLIEAIKKDIKPRDIVTKKSIENAVAVIMATGGSTNAVLHFLAIAHAAGVEWSIDDFERVRVQPNDALCGIRFYLDARAATGHSRRRVNAQTHILLQRSNTVRQTEVRRLG